MLVSVLITTYNSAKYIVETLDSVAAQTYSEIELVVSDDGSSDETWELCEQWLANHEGRFARAILTRTPHNLGISGNYNHALSQATGEWVKTLDGDDLLLPCCIAANVEASEQRPDISVWYSAWEQITADGALISRNPNRFPMTTARKQLLRYMLYIENLHSNTLFARREAMLKIGGFDMRYPMSQDIPMVYNFLLAGYAFGIMKDTYTIQFRHVMSSVSRSHNPAMNDSIAACRHDYSRYFLRYGLVMHWYNAQVSWFIRQHHNKGLGYRVLGYMMKSVDVVSLWYRIRLNHLKNKIET